MPFDGGSVCAFLRRSDVDFSVDNRMNFHLLSGGPGFGAWYKTVRTRRAGRICGPVTSAAATIGWWSRGSPTTTANRRPGSRRRRSNSSCVRKGRARSATRNRTGWWIRFRCSPPKFPAGWTCSCGTSSASSRRRTDFPSFPRRWTRKRNSCAGTCVSGAGRSKLTGSAPRVTRCWSAGRWFIIPKPFRPNVMKYTSHIA